MPYGTITKIIDFAREHSEDGVLEVVLSGGEPFLHPELLKILDYCHDAGVYKEITTNGSLIDDRTVDVLKKYQINNISISIDSASPDRHDQIRNCPGAFAKAAESIRKLTASGIKTRIRSTITKSNFHEMEALSELAAGFGLDSLAFGAAIPVGNAANRLDDLFTSKNEMKMFIETFFILKERFAPGLDIITNECLHGLKYLADSRSSHAAGIVLNGCTAGIVTFNVLNNGDITPCSMLHNRIANVYADDNLEKSFRGSEIIHALLDRNYRGRCGACLYRYECGGCRVRAEFFNKSYLDSDPLCWL